MPSITLTFSAPLNTSCQVGDMAYYVETNIDSGFTVNSDIVKEIGEIREIKDPASAAPTVICAAIAPGSLDLANMFILFSKDNKANLSSILGYYADIKFINDATVAAELFSVGTEVFMSSK